MSTTINSTTTATATTLTGAVATATNSMNNAGNSDFVIVDTLTTTKGAGDGGNSDFMADNTPLPVLLLSSSPCPTCSATSTWSDVLCANAMCSSSQQKQQSQQQEQQPLKNKEEEKQKQNIRENISGEHNENDNAPLNNTTTTIPTFLLIPNLAISQSNSTTTSTSTTQQQEQQQQQLFLEQQDTAAFDSGRESVNECDSSLDESINYATPPLSVSSTSLMQQQRNKKPCTLDFYASSGSQSKWYLPPRDIVKINVQPVAMVSSAMTKSCVSIAEPESSVITPPSDHGSIDADDGAATLAGGEMTKNDKIF